MSVDFGTLAQFLAWVVMGPGAGALSFWVLEKLAWFQRRSAEHKRYLSLAGTTLLSMGAFCASVGLGYTTSPIGWQAWLEALFAVSFVACGFGQVLHGRVVLSKQK
jgi:hypothetical protein